MRIERRGRRKSFICLQKKEDAARLYVRGDGVDLIEV